MFSTQVKGGNLSPSQVQGEEGQERQGEREYDVVERERRKIQLSSIRELRDEVMKLAHNGIHFSSPLARFPFLPFLLALDFPLFLMVFPNDHRSDRIIRKSHLRRHRRCLAPSSRNPTRRKTLPRRLWRSVVQSPSPIYPHQPILTYLSYEFFYQLGLSEFGNFGTIEFAEPLYIRDLLTIAMENDEEPKELRDEEMTVHPL